MEKALTIRLDSIYGINEEFSSYLQSNWWKVIDSMRNFRRENFLDGWKTDNFFDVNHVPRRILRRASRVGTFASLGNITGGSNMSYLQLLCHFFE